MNSNISTLRDLSKRVYEISQQDNQDKKRKKWADHHEFIRTSPPIYIRAFAFHEHFDKSKLKCSDPVLRNVETKLHELLFRDSLKDDFIIEPWLKLNATHKNERWGVPITLGEKTVDTGAAPYKPWLKDEGDINRLVAADHEIDEVKTAADYKIINESIGDIMEIDLDRGPEKRVWAGDISTDIAKIRGLEQIMWDAYDRPEWFHKLLTFMRDGILKNHQQAEDAGDWSLSCNENQAMCYSHQLEGPAANVYGKMRKDLWVYIAAQEYTTFSPMQFNEFMLEYQIPIMDHFGLSAYGCCEDLTKKIDVLRKIKNLKRIAVSPFADVRECAEQIGQDYILSWRPSPATMLATGLHEDFVRKHMRENFAIFKENNSFFDITLKDVETVNHQPENVAKWVQIVREELERAGL